MFPLPKSAAGSLQNCPECGRATKIAGDNDPLWAGVQGMAVFGLVLATVLAFQVAGPAAGLSALVAGGLILGAVRAAL